MMRKLESSQCNCLVMLKKSYNNSCKNKSLHKERFKGQIESK